MPTRREVLALASRAQDWLLAQQQPDGALTPGRAFRLGITAMALDALLSPPTALPATHPVVAHSLAYLAQQRQADGGVYLPGDGLNNYTTSLALLVWTRLPAPAGSATATWIAAARGYLLGIQNRDAGSLGAGGFGYDEAKSRDHADLPNAQFAIEGLRAAGVATDDSALRAALQFLERCQDFSSVNKAPWVGSAGAPLPDPAVAPIAPGTPLAPGAPAPAPAPGKATGTGPGGAVYAPAGAQSSWDAQATGDGQPERFTSTGTMTYALLSGYLALDLAADDPRVAAALGWVMRNYDPDFARNPGLAPQRSREGVLHLRALAARTLARLGRTRIDLPDGRSVDWRSDLFAAIRSAAQTAPLPSGGDGAWWINAAPRWAEGNPGLGTAYMLHALKHLALALPE